MTYVFVCEPVNDCNWPLWGFVYAFGALAIVVVIALLIVWADRRWFQ